MPTNVVRRWPLRVPAAVMLLVGGLLHLQLWRDGYKGIAFIGPLFLLNALLSTILAGAVLARGGRWVTWPGLAVAGGSLVALVLSRTVGLLGFQDSGWATDAIRVIAAEVGAMVALALVASSRGPRIADGPGSVGAAAGRVDATPRVLDRLLRRGARSDDAPARAVQRSDAEWRALLTPEQHRVLRRKGTERPFTGNDVRPGADGAYRCGGCGIALFTADTKFESGTGWPSFSDAIAENVEIHRELTLGIPRLEVVCRPCGGHLGHVFGDGPPPTRKRYCINAAALAPAS